VQPVQQGEKRRLASERARDHHRAVLSWPEVHIRAGIGQSAPIALLGDPSRRGAMTVFACVGQKPSSVGLHRGKSQSGAGITDGGSLVAFTECGRIGLRRFECRQGGDMACIRGPLGAPSISPPEMCSVGEPACGPVFAFFATMPRGHLLLVPGWRLGLLTEGTTTRTTREEAWTSYRGGKLRVQSG
jgi:hypothetical protein